MQVWRVRVGAGVEGTGVEGACVEAGGGAGVEGEGWCRCGG